jgi:hypothetical protein
MVECPAGKLAGLSMRKVKNNCETSPTIAVCAALIGVIAFLTRESYLAYYNQVGDDYLTLTWMGAALLVAVVGYAVQHAIRFGF